ncbi:putative membrane protein [Neisseria meningitidis 69176]|nr:putative membrane protein [Neisseria meningitidis 69176]
MQINLKFGKLLLTITIDIRFILAVIILISQ